MRDAAAALKEQVPDLEFEAAGGVGRASAQMRDLLSEQSGSHIRVVTGDPHV